MSTTSVAGVAIGAIFGAWSRWGLGYFFNGILPPLPLGTLIANLVGGYLVGFFAELFSQHSEIPPEVRLSVITGFLGALTTFSTFSAEAVTLLLRGQYLWAIYHITSHLGGSLVMTVLGIATVRRL